MSRNALSAAHVSDYTNRRSRINYRNTNWTQLWQQMPFLIGFFMAIITVASCLIAEPVNAIQTPTMQSNNLIRRAGVIGPADRTNCLSDIYCLPQANAVINTTNFVLQWNPYANKISTAGQVDIYLTSASDPYNNPRFISNQQSSPGSMGQIEVTVKPEYFSTKPQPGQTTTEMMYLWILPAREKPDASQKALPITLALTLPPTPTTSSTSTISVSAPTGTDQSKAKHSAGLSTGAIIGISVGGGVLLLIIIAGLIIWGIYRRRSAAAAAAKAKANRSGAPDSSAVVEANAAGGAAAVAAGSSDTLNAPASPGNLSAGDAILIAETYRQLMRKPSWKIAAGEGVEEEEEEDDDDGEALDPMLNRRKTGARVLMEELANEGHGLQNVTAGTAICIDDSASAVTETARHSAASTTTPLVTSLSPPGSPKSLTR
ncbi:hypothetical protein BDF19DRAFT_422533 [Syncephalis fuscata]|nr:hypothetical protein BDF19DRAFT_422533 [Syncephalis fuscata]